MDITNSQITKLKKMVTAAQEEFNMAVTYHEVWKPAAYDKDLHSRMGQSYASQAFLVMRIALRRETVLALMRLWDRNKQAVRMSLIVATICRERGHRCTSSRQGKALRLAWRSRADACRPSG